MKDLLPRLAIVVVAALVGLSIARVGGEAPLPFLLGGAIIAAIPVGMVALIKPNTENMERAHAPGAFLGIKIGCVGFCVAVFGWLGAVFISQKLGFVVIAGGIAVGFVGLIVHIVHMLKGNVRA